MEHRLDNAERGVLGGKRVSRPICRPKIPKGLALGGNRAPEVRCWSSLLLLSSSSSLYLTQLEYPVTAAGVQFMLLEYA
jgi:hypothetical protein